MKKPPLPTPGSAAFWRNVTIKALFLFIVCNLVFTAFHPMDVLGQVSGYNFIFPGRVRLPYGERPDLAYNLSLDNFPAMMAAHEISGMGKNPNEFRIVLIGDSSVWGYLLTPEQSLGAQMNQANLVNADGRQVRFYNLGYPTISLTKDLLFLSQALSYHPDLIIWLTTLEAFPLEKQLSSPIVQNNPDAVKALIRELDLPLDVNDPGFKKTSFWTETIVGQRRAMADLLRLQIYGILWAATGVDQYYPQTYEPPQHDLDAELKFHELKPYTIEEDRLAFTVLAAGIHLAGKTPVLIVNEPIYISDGENSNIRYNFFYPKWAYNQYREILSEDCQKNGWAYLDAWDLIPAKEFTNSAIHLSPVGTTILAENIITKIREMTPSLDKTK